MADRNRIKRIDRAALHVLSAQAGANPRLRRNRNLHASHEDPVQRLLNGFEPGTYVRPHRHPDKWELFVLLAGAAAVVAFDDAGRVVERVGLDGNDGARVVEIPADTWHTLVALVPGTVLLEIKRGPHDPGAAAEYAPWAPPEGDAQAREFEARVRLAQPGESVPEWQKP